MTPRLLLRKVRRNGRTLTALRSRLDAAPRRPRLPYGVAWNARYLSHYGFTADPETAADFHGPLCDDLTDFHETRGNKLAVIAPREGAKSTIITLGYVLDKAVEGHEHYIGITSDSAGQASRRLAEVAHELESNRELAADYPEACGRGPCWRNDRLELRNGVVIESLGTGQKILGRRNRQHRFTLIVFDDVESTDSVMSPVKREAAWRWATRAVIPAGSKRTNFLSVGSARHRECVAVRLGQLAGWSSRLHKAIHQWPDRMDLWDKWEEIATNLSDPDRAAHAKEFFEANRAAMEAGALVYWPSHWPLYDLMVRRSEVGRIGFESEWNGVPGVEGMTEFPAEWFDESPGHPLWFDEFPQDVTFRSLALDPSKGLTDDTGDYQAHVLVAIDRRGTLWVEGWLDKVPPKTAVAQAIDLAVRNQVHALTVEDNAGIGMIGAEFEEQLRERKAAVPLELLTNTLAKVVRIRRLGSYLGRNRVRFRKTNGTRKLVDQLKDFPAGDHDDGPDAMEMAVRRIELLHAPG